MESISAELKQRVLQNFASYVIADKPGFGKHVGDRIQVTELLYCARNLKAKAVCEVVVKEGKPWPFGQSLLRVLIVVYQDMLNNADNVLHACCSAYLIDM